MQRRTLFWSLMVILGLFGAFSFLLMPKLEDPALYGRQATVVVPYPGGSAHEVELDVALIVEEQLNTLPNIKDIRTTCREDVAIFTVEYSGTIEQKDMEQQFDLLRRKVRDFSTSLPQGSYTPIVVDDLMDVYGVMYALTGEGYDYEELLRYAKLIRGKLLEVNGVKRVNIAGTRKQNINITIDRDRLTANGLLPTQLMMALQGYTKPVSAGKYDIDDSRYSLRISGEENTIEDIKNLTLTTLNGKKVRLADVVQSVSLDYEEPQTGGLFVDKTPALAICVAMERDAVVPTVGNAIEKHLSKTMNKLPAGLELSKIYFQPDRVNKAVSSFALNVVESVAIVVLVLILFLGWRSGLVVGFGLLLTILMSFPILNAWGTTLQRMSLGAFIVAMGMLVDNAVVIIDGIMNERKQGLSHHTYLYNTVHNTAIPLLGATLIAIFAFIGVYLSKGAIAEYASDLFKVLCVSLLVSWMLAIIQIPVCTAVWCHPRREKQKGNSNFFNRFSSWIRHSIAYLLKHKLGTITVALLLLGIAVWGLSAIKMNIMPDFEYEQIIVECFWPENENADHVRDNLLEMTKLLEQNNHIAHITASQGSAPAHYCLVRPMTAGGSRYGELMIDFIDSRTLNEELPELRRTLRQRYPDAKIRFRKYNLSISTSHPIEVEFSGPDPAVLRNLASQAEQIMIQSPYVDAYTVQTNWGPLNEKIRMNYDKERGTLAGVSRSDVAMSLAAATSGAPIGLLQLQNESKIVYLRVRENDGSPIANLNETPVWTTLNIHPDPISLADLMSGNIKSKADNMFRTVPLAAVTNGAEPIWEENNIQRHNGRRAIEVECDPNPDNPKATADKATAALRTQINAIPLPDGYEMQWLGTVQTAGESISFVLLNSIIGIFIILLILLLLFNSWSKLAIILACVPFTICGIVPVLLITEKPLTFMVVIGVLGLMGMVIKNAIVLIDETDRLLSSGMKPFEAIATATASRTRPVLMASLTTILGMIPLIGDAIYGPPAIAIMGGLTIGTLITLVLIPFLYAAVYHIKPVQES